MTDTERPARFVTLEGIEGAGKSTALDSLRAQLDEAGIRYIVTREPGGTPVAERIRELVLEHRDEESIDPLTETLLMYAARAQLIAKVIRPALARGEWVVSDRFSDASIAYQGAGRGVGVERVRKLADWVHGDLWPDLTLLFDLPVEVGLGRVQRRGRPDRIEVEAVEFFERVRRGYLDIARREPDRVSTIDATASPAAVADAARALLSTLIQRRAEAK